MTGADLDAAAMALLESALDRDPPERRQWIEDNAADPAVRDRALQLLSSMDSDDRRLATGARGYGATDPLPDRIGGYRVIRQLGQGGMGAVFEAERAVGDFEHRVAIKAIRPGILSPVVIERFERERQILASLSHPDIARLYDGGTTEEGGPYFVMEYIEGTAIDRWCDDHDIPLETRLRLFVRVCEAVGAAHQNLIVHRDLTPSNVLVTPDGEPKLIDFGIAKPQGDEVADDPPRSRSSLDQLSLTPGYAAPERYEGAPATTLGDIFSLGKLLELLAAGKSEDRDLRAIVAMATAPDPSDRYASADALADDVRRYLAGFTVTARPAGRMAVFAKFYARHRAPVLASIAALVLLVGALAVAATAYVRAENARQAEATRVAQLRSLATYILFDHNAALERVAGNTTARRELVAKAQSYLVTLSTLGDDDPGLRLETANGFIALANIQGVSGQPNFGEHGLAKENLDRAEKLLARAEDPRHPDVAAAWGRLLASRALILMHADALEDEAGEALAEAARRLEAVPAAKRNAAWRTARSDYRRAQLNAFDLAMNDKAMAEAVAGFRAEIAAWPESERASMRARLDLAIAQHFFANHMSFGESLDAPRSSEEFGRADAMFAAIIEEQPNLPLALYYRAWNAYYGSAVAAQHGDGALGEQRLAQAERSIARLRTIEESDESIATFAERILEARADLYAEQGRFDEAIAQQQAVVDGRAAVERARGSSANKSDLAYGLVILADIGRRAGRRPLACRNYAEAERLMDEVAARDELRGFVARLRSGLKANLARCDAGAPLSAFTPPS